MSAVEIWTITESCRVSLCWTCAVHVVDRRRWWRRQHWTCLSSTLW